MSDKKILIIKLAIPIFIALFGILFTGDKTYAACRCNYSFCNSNACAFDPDEPHLFHGTEYFGSGCTDDSTCSVPTSGGDTWTGPCGQCDFGYGDNSNANSFFRCTASCTSGGGGGLGGPAGDKQGAVRGSVLADMNGNGSFEFTPADTFARTGSAAEACSNNKSSIGLNFATSGAADMVDHFECSSYPSGVSHSEYVSKTFGFVNDAAEYEYQDITLLPPTGFSCSSSTVEWQLSWCDTWGENCGGVSSGTGCTSHARIRAGGSNRNRLDWYLSNTPANTAPTSTFRASTCTPNVTNNVTPGVTRLVTTDTFDTTDNLVNVNLYRRQATVSGSTVTWPPYTSAHVILADNFPVRGSRITNLSWIPPLTGGYFQFTMDARDNAGLGCSGNPNITTFPVGITTKYYDCDIPDRDVCTFKVCPVAPGPVSGLACSTTTTNQIRVNWGALSSSSWGFPCGIGANSYNIEYKLASSSVWNSISVGSAFTTYQTPPTLIANTAYNFRIRSSNGEAFSAYSPATPITCTTGSATPGWFTSTAFWSNPQEWIAGFVMGGKPAYTDLGKIIILRNGTITDDSRISESGIFQYVKNMPVKDLWPSKFRNASNNYFFNVPAGAVPTTTLTGLNKDKAYYTASTALFSSGAVYSVNDNGVAVIYLTGSTPITISGNIRSSNPLRRLVLVTNRNIVISPSIGQSVTSEATQAHIEMAILTSGTISFPSINPGTGTDSTVIVEGPVVAANRVTFGRSRGSINNNDSPSEHIKYNARIIDRITSQERTSIIPNYTGLTTNEIIWMY
ncbi:MAG: hypothetical protein UU72_C0010G0020 [candidate division WWE3 bacterium GW2011_GWB1_41_6]|uniref:Fibronectin type-III domain-containing protein n=1 Tax=candidate division WWE3 bacterium GW2011_GWB1_41_6 TaxID=1619112 RepID=A0A0G0ZV26_UNCKA|nr:MAG: hypothetical protein UU72_C0010G0020 [candidate division WWE3 bacterium GW2011_GWB1_41_6]